MIIDRRELLAGGTALAIAACAPVGSSPPAPLPNVDLAALEAKSGGRLGVCILDTASGKSTGHRMSERFAMCSTFKLALAAAVLEAGQQRILSGDEFIRYTKDDLLPVSPVTTENLANGGMTAEALARATQITSDNAAANLLIKRLGGPEALTATFRRWGDPVTRLDRYETQMNDVSPGEIRDTSMPQEFARLVARLLATDKILHAASQEKLIGWMVETKTGAKRIRAGLPASWKSGDKTGTGVGGDWNNKLNDVAIFWPPARSLIVVAAYFEAAGNYENIRDADQAVLAEVGRIASAQAVQWHGRLD